MKACTKCKVEKSKSEFSKRKRSKDGLNSQCRSCCKAYKDAHRSKEDTKIKESASASDYHLKNRDAILERKRKYYAENKEYYKAYAEKNKEKISRYAKSWYEENKHTIKERRPYDPEAAKEWRDKNKESLQAYQKKYRKDNACKFAEYASRRRAIENNAEGVFSSDDIDRILFMQKYRCAYCKTCVKDGYHVDHVIALSKGGSNWPDNLQILCPFCNLSKGTKCPIQFAQENGRLL